MKSEHVLALTASLMPYEMLISKLDEAIKQYQIAPTTKNQEEVFMCSLLVVTKQQIEHDGGLIEYMKSMNEVQEAFEVGSRITGTDKTS
jgi:hypothetical protein